MTLLAEPDESEWTDSPTVCPCGCILNCRGMLFHQCETANLLLHNSLEAQRNGNMDLCRKLAVEYDKHILLLGFK